jgi:hypothetical protein
MTTPALSTEAVQNRPAGVPLTVAYGLGLDSTAALVELVNRGIRPDAILFADTGSEKQETYDYLAGIDAFLERNGFPRVTVVKYVPKNFKHWPPYYTLEENCLTNGTLPSLAFGFKSCSLKWKADPQDIWMETWAPATAAWAAGQKVIKLIGFDCSPADIKRYAGVGRASKKKGRKGLCDADRFEYWYPLIEWGWNRAKCAEVIAAAGLPVPLKSSCFFCPAMKPAEVAALPEDKLRRIVFMEARAKPRLTKIGGLWRKPSKKRNLPASMTEFIRREGLLPAAVIDHIIATAPTELLKYQEQFAAGAELPGFGRWVSELVQIEPARRAA